MDRIYGNSLCTIAATDSSDSAGGLFYERKPSIVSPMLVRLDWNEMQSHFILVDKDFWTDNISESSLNRRGWVLQERLLSCRIIHFGHSQISWECKTYDRCETFPDGIPTHPRHTLTRFKFSDINAEGASLWRMAREVQSEPRGKEKEREDDEESNEDGDGSLNGYYVWSRLLEQYTKTKLTNESDKLVAISGLARYVQREVGDKYLAGLWASILPSQLLWRVETFIQAPTFYADDAVPSEDYNPVRPRASRPSAWRAPS